MIVGVFFSVWQDGMRFVAIFHTHYKKSCLLGNMEPSHKDNVMMVLEGTKNKMCCIPIILSCWLCSYMNTVGVESRDKPLLILQHLQGKAVNPEQDTFYQGRALLMGTVIQKIVNDILPHQMRNTSQQYIPPESLPLEVMQKTLKTVFKKGLLQLQNLHTLEQLLTLCGSDWFCDKTVHVNCTPLLRRGRKRSRKEVELEDLEEPECRPIKRSKSMEPQLTLDSEGFNFDFLNSKDDGEASPMFDIKDPLNKALANLFRLMNAIVHDCDVSPRTSFIVAFIEEAVKCGSQYSRYIFQFMPPNMLPQLMKSVPGVFTNQQILHICDLSSQTGRKVASKAICQSSKFKPLGAGVN
ncbi:hypothetical protein KUTeg_008522 [Tegillarca granosa]|uniref:Mediator of RNA polymerase II transcription subunit 24 n=1 Tax=Tegillarca granosa TaxID=220873 RepID=A0ABQ9FCL6_TEGGR|nr:hypothetical protein KUTeg_008522 [Tegillarca granosa]